MPVDIYEDVLLWSEEQAGLLRRLAAGERVNAEIDWPALIEEIEDLGKSELRACTSNLRQAMVHLLKIVFWPDGPLEHWRTETAAFLTEAQTNFTPSMRQRIDLEALYQRARRQVASANPDFAAKPVPAECPAGLDLLLDEDVTVSALEARFRS